MTLQWIPLDDLRPHPENSNVMPPALVEKLAGHIARTGRYEPLVVRPLGQCGMRVEPRPVRPRDEAQIDGAAGGMSTPAVAWTCGAREEHAHAKGGVGMPPGEREPPAPANPQSEIRNPQCLYQIINGHHRAEALRSLGHTHARCDVWDVGDDEARLLLATLNRLEGRDDPHARARLVARLSEGRTPADLAHLLPEPPDAVERLLALAQPPAAPLDPATMPPPARPMTFFLHPLQHAAVAEALRAAGADLDHGDGPPAPRADRLERLALWFLEAKGMR
jgi:hypothetical protein